MNTASIASPPARGRWDLDTPILYLVPNVPVTLRMLLQGVQAIGGTGSGKTSTTGWLLLLSMLRHHFGGIILCSKVDDLPFYLECAAAAGRSDSVIVLGEGQPWRFNWLDYEWRRPGMGSRSVLSIMNLLSLLVEHAQRGTGGQGGGGGGNDAYWQQSRLQLIRSAVQLCSIAEGSLSLDTIYKILETAPQNPQQIGDNEWREKSECFHLLDKGHKRSKDLLPHELEDFDLTARYFLKFFAPLATETKSPILQGAVINLFDGFLTHPIREYFTTTTNVVPEMTYEGAIIIVNFPVKEYGEVGRLVNGLMKLTYQRAVERRDVKKYPRPVFLYVDEAQLYAAPTDSIFQTTARSQRVSTVYMFQNIDTLIMSMGNSWHAQHVVNSLLGNLSMTVFHANTSNATNQWASDRIGSTMQWRLGGNTASPDSRNPMGSASGNISETLLPQVLPIEFQTLRTGGEENNRLVDVIVCQQGRLYPDGKNYLQCTLEQPEQG